MSSAFPFRWLLIALSILPTISCLAPETNLGQVVHVADGDSFEIRLDGNGAVVKVRLYGIDAPEKGQAHGNVARGFARGLLEGQQVRLQIVEKDNYGRLVANAFLSDGRLVNHEIVKQGHAWWYRKYAPTDRQLAAFEAQAKSLKLGLWTRSNPKPPWQFRYEKRRR